jgi:hypothetical protein
MAIYAPRRLWVICARDAAGRMSGHVGFSPKATELLGRREITRWAKSVRFRLVNISRNASCRINHRLLGHFDKTGLWPIYIHDEKYNASEHKHRDEDG